MLPCFSDIESVEMVVNDKVNIHSKSIELVGSSNGGLVIGEEITKKLNAIEKDINSLKQIFNNWIPPTGAPDSGAALKGLLSEYSLEPLLKTESNEVENPNVKHG